MKKYEKPSVSLENLLIEDVILVSITKNEGTWGWDFDADETL